MLRRRRAQQRQIFSGERLPFADEGIGLEVAREIERAANVGAAQPLA